MGSHPHIEGKKVISVYTIETDRLLLRPFREGDAADVFEYLNAPIVNCFAIVLMMPMVRLFVYDRSAVNKAR